jgi:HSP20 family molecular chaperone IbpA
MLGNSLLMDPLFDLFATDNLPEPRSFRNLDMKTDVKDQGNSYLMEVEIPGVNKKDINVALNEGYLTVTVKQDRETNEKDKKGNYVHRERFSGVASRSYYVGNVDQKDVHATYADGVLALSFPKEVEKKLESEHSIAIQ